MKSRYNFYNDYKCGYVVKFVHANPEFDTKEFYGFLAQRNRGDRDRGELDDIAPHEVMRVAAEWLEYHWRFQYKIGDQS